MTNHFLTSNEAFGFMHAFYSLIFLLFYKYRPSFPAFSSISTQMSNSTSRYKYGMSHHMRSNTSNTMLRPHEGRSRQQVRNRIAECIWGRV